MEPDLVLLFPVNRPPLSTVKLALFARLVPMDSALIKFLSCTSTLAPLAIRTLSILLIRGGSCPPQKSLFHDQIVQINSVQYHYS